MLAEAAAATEAAQKAKDEAGFLVLILIVLTIILLILLRFRWMPRIRRAGYRGLGDFLRRIPTTPAQKRDALDLLLRGIVVFAVGCVLIPYFVVGLIMVYYGARKLLMAWMGLGVLEDVDEPQPAIASEPPPSESGM